MHTAKLKNFARAARQKLIEQVGARLDYILTTDTAELRERASQVKALKDELNRAGRDALVEKVAYTWFNRLMALRFMDVNDYQPLDLRVLSPKEGYTTPELLDEAKRGHIPAELRVDARRINDLLDGRLPSANPQNEAYRILLIAACNYLHTVLPFLFERLSDYSELLLPDDLTSAFSIVHDVREGMDPADCAQVEVIGWLYQFYISEKKDEVFAAKAKVKKEDIPAATQLFTPRWIVEYMVQNTVGKLWLQNKPDSRLRDHMPYFIESAAPGDGDFLRIAGPEELTLLDQACGSGHILVYGFELLTHIYEEEGYNAADIPRLIIERNLHGFEIDERAAQLAAMALMMKARSYQRRFFKRGDIPQPHVLLFRDLALDDARLIDIFHELALDPSEALLHDLRTLRQATNYGSLIVPQSTLPELEQVLARLEKPAAQADFFRQYDLEQLRAALHQLRPLARKYHCVVDNPPYMGGGNMNSTLAAFVKTNYPDSKADLMACFMERAWGQAIDKGFIAMINLPSWMFLSSFESFRKELIEVTQIESLLHLGRGIFGSDFGTVAFVIKRTEQAKINGIYRRLFKEHVKVRSVEKIKQLFLNHNYGYFEANQKDFEKIPGNPIAYWASDTVSDLFLNSKNLGEISNPKKGLDTGNNERFLRLWYEIFLNDAEFDANSGHLVNESHKTWYPIHRGGGFKKWFGNNEYLINWRNNGDLIKAVKDDKGRTRANLRSEKFYLRECITWGAISSANFSARYCRPGGLFGAGGYSVFIKNNSTLKLILGLFSSKLSNYFLRIISPTLNFEVGNIASLPFVQIEHNILLKLDEIDKCVKISKFEWDSHETSWDFQQNELLRIKKQDDLDLEETYDLYQQYWRNKFFQLHRHEEELNRQFIDIYGLQDELTPEVPLEEITILKEETSIQKGALVFDAGEVMAQFVSYAVGCMFGRYALDAPGLILANQGETLQDYLHRVPTPRFTPDAENIIPILDDAWFEDDIVGRFHAFLKASFGAADFAKNLAFVEAALGKDVRKYFIKDFYADHIRRYKKRPIYWLFSSPQGSFNVLIYLHRYTPDTLSQILNKYLREYQARLHVQQEHLDRVEISGTAAEKAKATKEKAQLAKVLLELQEYEREILYPLAAERIALDLDDGVLVNYNKLGRAVKPVPGLNDAKSKKKVRGFEWVEAGEVR